MFMPSFEIHQRMLTEYAGIWFVPSKGSDSHAILVKVSTNVIKAITKGCEVKVHFALSDSPKGRVLASCLQINDDPETPITITHAHIHRPEQEVLAAILSRSDVPLFLFDELNRNVAEMSCTLGATKAEVVRLIAVPEALYEGELDFYVSRALDNLQFTVDPTMEFDAATKVSLISLPLELSKPRFFNLIAFSLADGEQRFNVADQDEGGGLEQSIWQLVDDLFAGNTYRSPKVVIGNKSRELTDVLAITDLGTFLFESKAVGILSTSLSRTSARRVKSLEEQIKKATRQLVGGIMALRNTEQILSSRGKPIRYNREVPPHGVVLISEMLPTVNWPEITTLIIKASRDCSAFIHILDLSELLVMVSNSDSADYLDYFFVKRFQTLVEQDNAFFRMRFQRQ